MIAGYDFIGVGVGALIFNDFGEVFLNKRGSKANNERGFWSLPGGQVIFGETLVEAIKREVSEEFAMEIEVLEIFTINDHILRKEGQHWVTPTFLASYVSGEPRILEPEKCAEIGWFDLYDLPKPLSDLLEDVLKVYRKKYLRSE